MSKLCVFDMAMSATLVGQARKQPFTPCNALKYNDIAPLLCALVSAYARLYALIRAYTRLYALIRACTRLRVLTSACTVMFRLVRPYRPPIWSNDTV